MSEPNDDSDDEPTRNNRDEPVDDRRDVAGRDDHDEADGDDHGGAGDDGHGGSDGRRSEPDREVDESPGPTPRDPHPHTRRQSDSSDGDHWLSTLISALERLEGGSSIGQRRTDRTVLDYDISISSVSGSEGNESSKSPFESSRLEDSSRGDTDRERPQKRRRRGSSTSHHLTTRTTEEELLVTADVAGTDPDEITVGFDDGVLVVAVSGREIDRIDVPWDEHSADATIKNGILTVEVTPETDPTDEGDDDG